MSGDGVSLPTTLAQIGQVAKTLARGQQAGVPTAGQLPDQDKDQLQPIRKIQEAEAKGKKTVKRRQPGSRQPGSRHQGGRNADDEGDEDQVGAAERRDRDAGQDTEQDPDAEQPAAPIPDLGTHIDIKA